MYNLNFIFFRKFKKVSKNTLKKVSQKKLLKTLSKKYPKKSQFKTLIFRERSCSKCFVTI